MKMDEPQAPHRRKRQHRATADDLDLSRPVELVALLIKERAARCRLLGNDRVITLRASGLRDVVPGEIVTVKPRKQWRYAGHPYLSGEIESTRLDVAALGLVPVGLEYMGMWDPIDNRPFLRCMHGYALCVWRLGRFDEAERVFNQMLWLNPSDNQGVHYQAVCAAGIWEVDAAWSHVSGLVTSKDTDKPLLLAALSAIKFHEKQLKIIIFHDW